MRVILDTNVLVSGLISPGATPAKLLKACFDGRFTLISNVTQIQEFREVTRREPVRSMIHPAQAGRLVNEITSVADMPSNLPIVERSPDPWDDFLLALCEVGEADLLVTGDKKGLLALKRHGRTKIITPADFAKLLKL